MNIGRMIAAMVSGIAGLFCIGVTVGWWPATGVILLLIGHNLERHSASDGEGKGSA